MSLLRFRISSRLPKLLRLWTVFFFQAEDGIRDYKVTGVQTCALPISKPGGWTLSGRGRQCVRRGLMLALLVTAVAGCGGGGKSSGGPDRLTVQLVPAARSEERRVGEEGRSRWAPYHLKKKKKRLNESE